MKKIDDNKKEIPTEHAIIMKCNTNIEVHNKNQEESRATRR